MKRKLLSQMTKDKVLKIKNKYKFKQSPCLGVYHPMYDSIGKHSYQVTFERQNLIWNENQFSGIYSCKLTAWNASSFECAFTLANLIEGLVRSAVAYFRVWSL